MQPRAESGDVPGRGVRGGRGGQQPRGDQRQGRGGGFTQCVPIARRPGSLVPLTKRRGPSAVTARSQVAPKPEALADEEAR